LLSRDFDCRPSKERRTGEAPPRPVRIFWTHPAEKRYPQSKFWDHRDTDLRIVHILSSFVELVIVQARNAVNRACQDMPAERVQIINRDHWGLNVCPVSSSVFRRKELRGYPSSGSVRRRGVHPRPLVWSLLFGGFGSRHKSIVEPRTLIWPMAKVSVRKTFGAQTGKQYLPSTRSRPAVGSALPRRAKPPA